MKRIVIACDGTWNRLDAEHPTNVVKLAQAVLPRGPDGVEQLTYHLDGVGSGRGTGTVARQIDRALGGLFGQGLMTTVEAAYRLLVFNYAPGDQVLLFGFSRGAYTARTLAGLIRNCGIPERRHAAAIPAALALYRARTAETGPDGPAARAFRARHSAHVTTGPGETEWRSETLGADASAALPLRIGYLGIWDTVGALGLPRQLWLARRVNRAFAFHDTRLSRMVASARHAVAVDERRRNFPPALWDNLDGLNAAAGDPRRYEQRWFPGDHGSIGGGGEVTALSDDALLWVAEGAVAAGLALDPAALAGWSASRDCLGPLAARGSRRPGLLGRMLSLDATDRAGPAHPSEVAEATRQRWRRDPRYRPGTLGRVASWLEEGAAPA